MPATITQARDEMSAVLADALVATDGDSPDFSDIPVAWPDKEFVIPKDTTVTWARFVIRHATGGNVSLGSANGTKRYNRAGVLAVQLFTPIGLGYSTTDLLTSIIMEAYEKGSTPNGVWFRNVRLVEVGVTDGWNQTNVISEFEYDEVR